MNDREFDCAMRRLALAEGQRVSTEKLERVLRSLPPAAPAAPTRPRIRMAAVLAALLLLAVGVAVAARLGLSAFWANNPYRFFHNRERTEPQVRTSDLAVTDASGLSTLRLLPLDSAWIEGRLTLTFSLTAEAGRERPLLGQPDETGFLVWQEDQSQWVERVDLLVCDTDVTAYTRRDDADGWAGYPSLQCMESEEGLMLALQFEPDFITASDLPTLMNAQGCIPIRLELWVYDARQGDCAPQSALLSVRAPTEEERMEMNP